MQVYEQLFLLIEITSSIRTIVNSSNTIRILEVFTQIAAITLSETLCWLLLKNSLRCTFIPLEVQHWWPCAGFRNLMFC